MIFSKKMSFSEYFRKFFSCMTLRHQEIETGYLCCRERFMANNFKISFFSCSVAVVFLLLVEGGWRLSVSSSMQFFVLPLIQKNTRLMLNFGR